MAIQEPTKSSMLSLARYVDPKDIFFLNSQTREDVLIDLEKSLAHLPESDRIFKAINEREKIVSTGIGMGVAIPHAKLPGIHQFFIAFALLSQGVDWNSLDGAPVRLVFLIGGPDDKQTEYLQILSVLTSIIRDEGRRKKLLTAKSVADILNVLRG